VTRFWVRTTFVAALAALAVAAPAAAADQTITFPTGAAAAPYSPNDVTIGRGETVTFNGAFMNHPLVWDAATFDTQSSGMSRAYTFPDAGTFMFHCMIHASMTGVVRVTGDSGDQLGTPDFTWSPSSPQTGQAVTFTPTGFTDPDGSIQRYEWDLDGDGSFETTGASPSKTYANAGNVTVRLRYVDDRGQTSSATAHALTVRAAGGEPGGPGSSGSGAPNQPGASGSPSGSPGTDQGAGTGGAGSNAPRLRIAARALVFHGARARATIAVPRAAAVTASLKRAGVVLATGRATARRAGTITITLKLTSPGARALRRGAVRATLTVVARPRAKGAKATTVKKTLRVSRAG
jgi:plastocyanin